MNISELLTRTNAIAAKYEKYTTAKEPTAPKTGDQFTQAYTELVDRINDLSLKADEIAKEPNRAAKAALNAEQRKAKAALLEVELPHLQKLVRKGKTTPEIIADREVKVAEVKNGIEGIADGLHGGRKMPQKSPLGAGGGKGKAGTVNIDASGGMGRQLNDDYYAHTDASKAFQQEFEAAKRRQDKALDNIEKGVGTMKGIAEALGDKLKEHDDLITAIDEKMDDVNKDLRTNNMKLKGLVTKMRSTRNFCVDVVLICIVLAIALYIFNMVRSKKSSSVATR